MMQPFAFEQSVMVSDGLNGRVPETTTAFSTMGEFTSIKAKRSLEAAQISLKPAFSVRFRNNPSFVPKSDHTVVFRNNRYTIQTIEQDNDRQWYLMTILEQGPNATGIRN